MSQDELNLRASLWRWKTLELGRDGLISMAPFVKTRHNFAKKYGWDELHRIDREVTIAVAKQKTAHDQPIERKELPPEPEKKHRRDYFVVCKESS
jgi:hypothetical protein